jgi:hypothetical protein
LPSTHTRRAPWGCSDLRVQASPSSGSSPIAAPGGTAEMTTSTFMPPRCRSCRQGQSCRQTARLDTVRPPMAGGPEIARTLGTTNPATRKTDSDRQHSDPDPGRGRFSRRETTFRCDGGFDSGGALEGLCGGGTRVATLVWRGLWADGDVG